MGILFLKLDVVHRRVSELQVRLADYTKLAKLGLFIAISRTPTFNYSR